MEPWAAGHMQTNVISLESHLISVADRVSVASQHQVLPSISGCHLKVVLQTLYATLAAVLGRIHYIATNSATAH